ncbi:esterase-like activity of phytase family protein [Advenella mimigardefordensis]|uniref:NHL domain-containing protein n=1 Tax=Advenella mimigardefordensis (strain DSM 17166 / LMG 22922 / DPN7) TaxID=1247726 RepID=W0PHJ6_ADVMD|nr:esterase-like activity of phytase family protein [Advenella mimigardefordensis]AHG64428.1 NHL domain-containing protein [Advenella mimigardefordensis DPN7]
MSSVAIAQTGGLAIGTKGSALPYQVIEKIGDVEIRHGGYGSSAFRDPGHPDRFYAMTDRGPNADGPTKDSKVFPVPAFTPSIGHFAIESNGSIKLLENIPMRRPDGTLLTGLPNPKGLGSTGETALDLAGKVLSPDPYGIDSEGLAVAPDGSFWVSDEYGPHIVHFSAKGIELERISPVGVDTKGRKLPAVLARRTPNRGMEGLTITPDGKTLVGTMQSTLSNPDKKSVVNKTLVRIVSFDLESGKTKQYVYRQNRNHFSNSEILALDNHRFLIDERDSEFPGVKDNVQKHVYLIDLRNATDVSGDVTAPSGMLVNGKTLEQNSWQELEQAGIKPVAKSLVIDMVKEHNYPHEKFEGMWLLDDKHLAVINDDDFGIINQDGKVTKKILPATGKVDANTVYVYPLSAPAAN